jgi:hypothetical protein
MTPPTYRPSTIYVEIDVSGLSLIDAERYYNAQKAGFPMPCGCSARGRMDLDEVEA